MTVELTPEEMRALGYRVVDTIVDHLATLKDKPATGQSDWDSLEAALAGPLPEDGASTDEVMDLLDRELLPYGAGTLTFIRMMGGAMGVNCLAIVLDHRTARHGEFYVATQTAESGATADVLFPVMDLLAEQGLTYGEQWSMAYLYLGRMVAAQASSLAFQDAYMVLTVAFGVAITITILTLRGAGAVGAKVS